MPEVSTSLCRENSALLDSLFRSTALAFDTKILDDFMHSKFRPVSKISEKSDDRRLKESVPGRHEPRHPEPAEGGIDRGVNIWCWEIYWTFGVETSPEIPGDRSAGFCLCTNH